MHASSSQSVAETASHERWFMHAAYPLLWAWLGLCLTFGFGHPEQLATVAAVKGLGIFLFLLFLELRYPLQRRWGMTWALLLKRDAVLAAVNMGCAALLGYLLLILSIGAAGEWQGAMTGRPLWLQVVVGLLVFEALQYTLHRLMHRDDGPVTRFLWHVHAIHHLPRQLYLVMHIVFHPLNLIVIRLAVQLAPIWVLGFDPVAVFVYGSVIGLHGTVSHLNFDLRLGWMNYLFVGPELHRFHHSESNHEAQNYGAALSIYDQLFGTFHYTPGRHPRELGLSEASGYPGQTQPGAALLFPFRRAAVRRDA